MQVRIARWGDSLAVRLPEQPARRLGLAEGQFVDITVEGAALVLRQAVQPAYHRYNRDELIAQINPDDPSEPLD